jgi:hypothetical protein
MLDYHSTRQAEAELHLLLAETADQIDTLLAFGFLHPMERDRLTRAANCVGLATNRVMRPSSKPAPISPRQAESL